ncbi:xyloglucan O-acetyltransferase 3-like [Salvia miltiorrhiza]|uniref:xyloglucan O-acetyltransferase 3-like n=1 Tax=Salvia miltiorrhiza TaxID=226208 RepID=UPI0025AC561B|nr:xyloglucan O-acetyltransferase 3-like [Salvia miltiorrhiza]
MLKKGVALTVFWSQFLFAATELIVNGTATGNFDLHLDRADPRWTAELPSIDYAVFSGGPWFVRKNYLYEDGNLIGCIYCRKPKVTDFGPGRAIRRAFRAVLRAVNECGDCKKIVSFVRTYSPSHFENGSGTPRAGATGPDPLGGTRWTRPGPSGSTGGFKWKRRRRQGMVALGMCLK